MHKAGFVNIVGNPNVGKSTLMNSLVGERISIITSKAQTTRHRIMGIVNTDDMQIVYSDTPGVLKPVSKLHESMLAFSQSALQDADVLLYLTDTVETPDKNQAFLNTVQRMSNDETSMTKVIVVINKMDLVEQDKLVALVDEWHERLPKAEIVPISALHKFGTDILLSRIKELLPECPPYFDKEIPYSCQVEVESFKEGESLIDISALIYVERDSQKGIIIGKQGAMLKKLGMLARKDIEAFFGKKVMLKTFVKVEKDWRNNIRDLNLFGYNPE